MKKVTRNYCAINRKKALLISTLFSAVLLSACSKSSDPAPVPTMAPTAVPTTAPTATPTPEPIATPTPEPTATPTPNPDDIGYFEDRVIDDTPTELFAADSFDTNTNDTSRLQSALNSASNETDGGEVILRGAAGSDNTRFSLARIAVPSNVRIKVDPDVILEMRGPRGGSANLDNRFLFTIGRSSNSNNLMANRIENVEISSTDPEQNFTIDAKTHIPLVYGGGGTKDNGVSLTRAIPVGLFYVENFKVSNITIEDNHSESVSVQMYADTDYKDGAYAIRHESDRSQDVFLDAPAGDPLPMNGDGAFIDGDGNVIEDMFAIVRNPTWARTPIKGTIKNISALNAHTGYGAVQVYGGDWIEMDNIESFNGIGVRIEAGNGADNDNNNRAGPYYSTMTNIDIKNVKVTNGFTGVWIKAHSKLITDISVHNIEAINSGTALLVEKGTLCHECRDLTRGRVDNLSITGDIILRQTDTAEPVAEVGYIATFLLSDENRQEIATDSGKSITSITYNDIERNLSGQRWYLIRPLAPVLALSQLSASEIGDQSAEEGFFGVDYSNANIVRDGVTRPESILYRTDMKWPNGNNADNIINE